eukprot:tig00020604_g11870.t1
MPLQRSCGPAVRTGSSDAGIDATGLPAASDNVRVDAAYDVLHRSRDGVPERYEATELKSRSPAAAWNRWHADRARGAGAGPRMHMPAQQRQLQPQTIRVTVSPPMAAPPPLGSAVMVRVVRVAERAAAARSGLRPSYANVPAFPSEALPAFLARVAERFGVRPAPPTLGRLFVEAAGGAAEIAETAALLAVGSDLVIYAAPGDLLPGPAPPASPAAPASAPRAPPGPAPQRAGLRLRQLGLVGPERVGVGGLGPGRPLRRLRIEPRGGHPPQPGDFGPSAAGAGAAAEPRRAPAPTARRVRLSPLAASAPGALPPSSACLTYAPPSTHVLPPPLLLPAAPRPPRRRARAPSPAPSALSGASYPPTPGSALSRRTVHEEAAFLHRLYGGRPRATSARPPLFSRASV